MKVAIVGFAGSGKSTCFRVVTKKTLDEIEKLDPTKPRLGSVKIDDERLEKLKKIFNPKKLTPAEIVFEDLPGFHIPQIKDVDSIMEVVGVFSGRDPVRDIEDVDAEFIIADLSIVDKRLASVEKELKQEKTQEKIIEKATLIKAKEALEKNIPLRYLEFQEKEEKAIRGFQFLSRKPIFIIGNMGESPERSEFLPELDNFCESKHLKTVEFPAKLDAGKKEAAELVINATCEALGYITFFTVKGSETKAWLLKRGTKALFAAGKIHTDIQKGFMKAEVINLKDLESCGSLHDARQKGLLKLEGKEYIIQDGDVVDFKFNV